MCERRCPCPARWSGGPGSLALLQTYSNRSSSWHRRSSRTWPGFLHPHHLFWTPSTMAWSTPGRFSFFALRVSNPLNPRTPSHHIIHTHCETPLIQLNIISIPYQVFKFEPFLLAIIVFYVVFFWFGSKMNRTKANTWFVSSSLFFIRFYRAFVPPDIISVWAARAGACMRLVQNKTKKY